MRKSSVFKIKEQIDNYGFYGEVDIEFEVTNNYGELKVIMDNSFERWHPGILFGASYFLEHCLETIGLILTVKNIEYHEVDTNNTIIAYLIYNALLKETDLKHRGKVILDKPLKSFVFLK